MPSPFPGMDPFLEDPAIFPDLHDSAVTYLREMLQAQLPDGYYAALGSRIFIEETRRYVAPDVDVLRAGNGTSAVASSASGETAIATRSEPVVIRILPEEIRETFVEVYARDGRRLVTVIELLSLRNKTPGEDGMALYRQKQREICDAKSHLVEIDLLRAGRHATAVPEAALAERAGAPDYHVCVRRFDTPTDYIVYPAPLQEPLPEIAVPLLPGEGAVPLDLQALLTRCYEVGRYKLRVNYSGPVPPPALSPSQAAWLASLLREKGFLGESPAN
jgi:Protein of unknown function (DUF4058)